MLKQMSARLLAELEKELGRVSVQVVDPLDRLVQSLKLTRDALGKLKAMVLAQGFEDEDAEVDFFKRVKPAFYCHQIYCTEMYTMETGVPFGDKEQQVAFFLDELAYLERYFKKYAFQYQYYLLDAVDLDGLYFMRGKVIQSILMPNVPDLDPVFSTPMDYLFAKFRAFDLLKIFLMEKLVLLREGNAPVLVGMGADSEELRWTGETINLAELGYGLFHSGQLNNGTAGIGLIFRWLEEKFRVTIGVPAKRFAEIRSRKRLSRTHFLEQMIDALLRKMDQDDGLPGRGRDGER